MRGLSFILSLMVSLLGFGGYLAFDYSLAARSAHARGEEPMGFATYLGGWVGFASLIASSDDPAGAPLPETLIAMLPRVPEGWTVSPGADPAAFLGDGLSDEDTRLIADAATENPGKGVDQVRQTYSKGPRSVVFELVRYPDLIFTSFMAMQHKMMLQMATFEIASREYMTVRGLAVMEATLPEGAPARVFLADVGGQIHLRVTASPSLSDEDLLALFQTLHVPAMNADVVEKKTGLGEVPVIVLASVIDEETRRAREAEWEAEKAAREAEAEKAAAEAEAEAKAAEEAGQDPEAAAPEEEKQDSGVKIRKGNGEASGSTFGTPGGTLGSGSGSTFGSGCRQDGARKVCGGVDGGAAEGGDGDSGG